MPVQITPKIINLKQYDIVFTTSFECPHGVSGHLYEMIDYYYATKQSGINSAILLTDGTPKELFANTIIDKYSFTEPEYADILHNTYESPDPKIIMANNICVVDGSWRYNSCTVYTNNIFLLRCSEVEFERFHNHKTIKQTHLLQDFNLYPERYEHINIKVVNYVKKILWSKYREPKLPTTDTALFYLTTNCRALSPDIIETIINRHQFKHYLVVTNDVEMYSSLANDDVTVAQAPVKDIFDQFDTYIYTATPLKADCSPRFIVECAVYNKEVIYEIDYVDPGIRQRQIAIQQDVNQLLLTVDDDFIKYVKDYI